MPKLDPKTMQKRRQHILDAAVRQFAKRGFGGASVDDICDEARISKGALYTHFESKEAIMLEIIRQRGLVYEGIRASSLAELEELVFDLFLRGLDYTDSRLEMEAVTIGASNELVKTALTANSDRCEARLRAVLDELAQAGKIALRDGVGAGEAAVLIHTYVLGWLSRQIYETNTRDEEARRGLRLTVDGLIRATT